MQAIRRAAPLLRVKQSKLCLRPLSSYFCNMQINRFTTINRISMATTIFDQISVTSVFPLNRRYCATAVPENDLIDEVTFEKVCEETLDSLCDYFEGIIEKAPHLNSADVSYGSGVLTVNFGDPYGTYVINRQSPNRQIWLSSPTSGPKRYDYVKEGSYWIYRHDRHTLHQLLQDEIPNIVEVPTDFSNCMHSSLKS